MVQTCSRCARANPPEALYCYFDGTVLGQAGTNGGPINTGTRAFPHLFTFPSGKICHNFDQLALACQENWQEALELLEQGYLENFLAGLGRADLARAAREAAKFPDRDCALDQFLGKLPGEVLDPAKLAFSPAEFNLGKIRVGEDRVLELHLVNQGMRLLHGSITCEDCVWLGVGEAPGAPQKLFQFSTEKVIGLYVRGKQMRAGLQPLQGRLVIESNGGNATVPVRGDVPPIPFMEGIYSGAQTPRQIAEKAKAHLRVDWKEAAAPFENGAVARWYNDNGWIYPVQEPVAEGTAAVQQFFDALGLSKPPRVEISQTAITFQGNVGVELRQVLEIKSPEKRPIYAYGTCDQPWLKVGRAWLSGRTATLTIPLVIPSVPDREGQNLIAKVTIIANGNQRFTIPVRLEVGGNLNFAAASVATTRSPEESFAAGPADPHPQPIPTGDHPDPAPNPGNQWLHAVPAIFLGLGLFLVVLFDLANPPQQPGSGDGEFASVRWKLAEPDPRIGVKFNETMRFGILMLNEKDPARPDQFKKLTAREDGGTNNTCIRLDGRETLFGIRPGEWVQNNYFEVLKQVPVGKNRRGWMSYWKYPNDKVLVRQTVEIVPNEQTLLLDTCLVHYLIENQDTIPHKVGIRVMLDTYIGANDGVPFIIPGQQGLLETKRIFDQKNIPDYIEALEYPNLTNPGTIAHLGLKLQGIKIRRTDPDVEPLEKLVVCRWPGNSEKRWSWDYKAMNEPPDEKKDSCVVLYWEEQDMEPMARRALAFTYGVGRISSSSGNIGITVGGSFQPGKDFTLTAYVKNPKDNQTVKLNLSKGLSLTQGEGGEDQKEEQTLGGGQELSQVSWRVKAAVEGVHTLEVASGLDRQMYKVQIRKTGLFD
ncbi:MAG TPA: hypothetical protein VGY77_03390 [Gemmataceae bacterium]|nr:hypothetical protein [Gemmataceae bacterium]